MSRDFSIIEKHSIFEAVALKIQRLCLFELHCHLIGMKIVNKVLSFLTPRDTKILVSLFCSYKAMLYKRVISLFSYISLFLAQYLQTGTSSCSTTRFDQQQSKIIKSLMRFYSLAIKKTKKDKTSLFLAYQILWNGILKPMARFIYEEGIKKTRLSFHSSHPPKHKSEFLFFLFFSR